MKSFRIPHGVIRRAFPAIVWALTIAAAPQPPAPVPAPPLLSRAAPLRIMALGDSITAGVGADGARVEDGGYRGPLTKLLRDGGYRARFVGSRTDYSAEIQDRAHEGWPGYVLRSFPSDPGPGQLYGSLTRSAIRSADPDVILLMAGTNDLLRLMKGADGYTLPNIMHSMDLLLGEIFEEKPGVRVIVAPVVASLRVSACVLDSFDGIADCDRSTGESLKTLVDAYAKHGYRISFAAPMARAVARDRAHFPDGIHPCGAGGYSAVAQAWYDAIGAVTAPTLSPPQPVAHR